MFNSHLLLGAFAAMTFLGTESVAKSLKVSKEDIEAYPSIAQAMEDLGGDKDWKSYQTRTEDGYDLTLFRITQNVKGQGKGKAKKGPLLFLHGFSVDAYSWLLPGNDPNSLAIAAQLSEDGYDVWLGNFRGGRFNRSHETLDPDADDDEFWDFDNEDLAVKDVPAMIELIHRESNTCKKVSIYSISGGTVQTSISLAKSANAQNYVGQALLMEPCYVASVAAQLGGSLSEPEFAAFNGGLDLLGIRSLFGPQWDSQLLQLKLTLGEANPTYQAFASQTRRTDATPNGYAEFSVKHIAHYTQNFFTGRFQEYADMYFLGMKTKPEFDLGDISPAIPIKMIIRTEDLLCPEADQTKYIDEISNLTDLVRLPGGHALDAVQNDPVYKGIIDGLLADNGIDMDPDVCKGAFVW